MQANLPITSGQAQGLVRRDSHGDVADGYGALTSGAAVVDRSHTSRVEHAGKDALDLLNRLSTNYLMALEPGTALRTALTSDRGRIVAVLTVVRPSPDRLLLLTDSPAATVMEWIERFTFEEDARLLDLSAATAQVAVAGPGAAGVIEGLAGPEAARLSTGGYASATVASYLADVVRTDAPGLPCWEIAVGRAGAADLSRAAVRAGAVPAGKAAWEAIRIERGVPASGHELTEDANPLEAGLKDLVSFTKGCYVGQEVVARLDTYEKVQRSLVGLLSEAALTAGDTLWSEGREAGRVTSSAFSPGLGRHVGLGYVRRNVAGPGTKLDCASGAVTVSALPISG